MRCIGRDTHEHGRKNRIFANVSPFGARLARRAPHSKKTHCVTHVCNTDLGVYIEYTVCYTVTTHCVTHYTVCYTVIENREVILQYTLELTINYRSAPRRSTMFPPKHEKKS